jgi:prophage antirepressor-like protein
MEANLKKRNVPVPDEGETKIDLFHKREIRKRMHNGEWWFSVKDILEALTDTTDGTRYSRDLRTKDAGLKDRWAEITLTLNYDSGAGGRQDTTFINIEGIFRLMQSVPTTKAEPFKKWLARVGSNVCKKLRTPN